MIKQYEIPIIRNNIMNTLHSNRVNVNLLGDKIIITLTGHKKQVEFDTKNNNIFQVIGYFQEFKKNYKLKEKS